MGIYQSLKNIFFSQKVQVDKQASNHAYDWGGSLFGATNSSLSKNEYVFSVVSRLSNTVSSLPLKLYKEYDVQSTLEWDKLFYNANSNQSMDQLINALEVSKNTHGNGYGLIERGIRASIESINVLNPDKVTPMLERNSRELWYRISGDDGGAYFVHNTDLIHVQHISENGNLSGISPISVLNNAIQFDDTMRNFSLKEMESLRNSFILSYGANVSVEKKQAVVEDFRQFYKDNGGVLFEESGVEIKELKRDFVAGDMKISDEVMRARVANVFNIPSVFLNSDTANVKSNEHLMQLFVTTTLTPIVRQYEREFNKKLLTQNQRVEGFYYKFNLNSLLRGDTQARQTFYHGAIRDGYMTPDDIRRLEDLPPMGGKANELWISGDMYTMSDDSSQRAKNRKEKKDEEVLGNEAEK
jgi:HK97 family phage portal protein